MKILIAKSAGFCMGVRRAVEMALDAPGKHASPIFTFGPLIHNPQVLDLLKEKKIRILETVPEKGRGTVLIRAHGVPPHIKKMLASAGFDVIDATCPRVIKVQTIIAKHAKKGWSVIIAGDQDHPEVIGLLGFAGGRGHVVGTLSDLEKLPVLEKAIIVAQTTHNTGGFEKIKKWAEQNRPHYQVFNTICDSTERRQKEARHLAETVDSLIVVGGKSSGNTRRLAQIASELTPSFHIETEDELDVEKLASARCVGITAGASTPNWIIRKVCRKLETISHTGAGGKMSRRIHNLKRYLTLTNVYVALGAGCLGYVSVLLQNITRLFPHVPVAVTYVLSMHLLNNLTGNHAARYNDPDRAEFYSRFQIPLILLALAAGGVGLASAYTMGPVPFSILLVMSLLGLSYNLKVVPNGIGQRIGFKSLRDIPGSKTILIALAWGIVIALLPALYEQGRLSAASLAMFLWTSGLLFVRSAFFDILDMQGDRIVGKETLPILIGEKKSLILLKGLLAFLALLLPLFSALGIFSQLGFFLCLVPAYLYHFIKAYEKGGMLPGTRLEFWVESHLIFAGVLAIIWKSI